jgi:hypothetical protein
MLKPFTFLVLVALHIGSLDLYANAHPSPQCACHCETDMASFQVWQAKDGPPDRFVAKAIRRWFNRIITDSNTQPFSKTEHLLLLGRSGKGNWSVESQLTDAEGAVYTNLVCTSIAGKRKVFPLVERLYDMTASPSATSFASSLAALVLRRLRRLAKSGQWDVGSLIPVQLPLLAKPPALVFHPKGKRDSDEYVWSLSVKRKDGRLVRIEREQPGCCGLFFAGAKCFGGVTDDANGETWWILVKTVSTDNCGGRWYSIRLTNEAPVKQ